MNTVILNKAYGDLPFCEREILRYAGCKSADSETEKLLKVCLNEADGKLNYKVCYRLFPVSVHEDMCDFGAFSLKSYMLSQNLKSCDEVIIFAATVGVGIDRLISKYGRLSPSKALMFQAIGAERIETLCDFFCEDIKNELNKQIMPRFSPGYGDLPLEIQKNIFSVLDCEKRIGLTLNDSLLMSPSKSVTAFVGISNDGKIKRQNKCAACDKKDCNFRRENS